MMRALTVRSDGILSVITSEVGVSVPFIPETQTEPIQIFKFTGIWDTGASGSVITKTVVEKLGLEPISVGRVYHAGGESDQNVYLVNIALPGNVMFSGVRVTEAKLPGNTELLIGMDIITTGDFSITNFDKKTVMSFRVPSHSEVDFVPMANNHNKFEEEKKKRKANKKKKRKKK